MKLRQTKSDSQGPSSSIGIMKFNDSLSGPKLSPEFVVGASIFFIILIVVLKVVL